jgi:hypothetical protein
VKSGRAIVFETPVVEPPRTSTMPRSPSKGPTHSTGAAGRPLRPRVEWPGIYEARAPNASADPAGGRTRRGRRTETCVERKPRPAFLSSPARAAGPREEDPVSFSPCGSPSLRTGDGTGRIGARLPHSCPSPPLRGGTEKPPLPASRRVEMRRASLPRLARGEGRMGSGSTLSPAARRARREWP